MLPAGAEVQFKKKKSHCLKKSEALRCARLMPANRQIDIQISAYEYVEAAAGGKQKACHSLVVWLLLTTWVLSTLWYAVCGKHIRDVIFCNALANHGLFRFSFTFIFHLPAFGYSEKESLAQISAACTRNPSKVAAEVKSADLGLLCLDQTQGSSLRWRDSKYERWTQLSISTAWLISFSDSQKTKLCGQRRGTYSTIRTTLMDL